MLELKRALDAKGHCLLEVRVLRYRTNILPRAVNYPGP